MKLYTHRLDHFHYYLAKVVAEITQAKVETVVVSQEEQESTGFKAKRGHGKFPMLELENGTMIYESNAIAEYFARTSPHSEALCGSNAYEEAQINQWVLIAATGNWPHSSSIAYNTFGFKYDLASYNDAVKAIKDQVKILNKSLENKRWLVGSRITLADISQFTSLYVPFTFVLDGGIRKAFPLASAWFERIAQQESVIRVMGQVKLCEKQVKPVDTTKVKPVEAKPVAKVAPAKKEEAKKVETPKEDEFDPFADEEEEDEEAEKARMDRMKALAKPAKKGLIAKSLIIWEVKPWGEETDLDAVAKRILAIEMDGLVWKTEYKKEPVAYGINKIVIGAVVEDEKVSTDLVQEMIEADEENVQSVDIASFNKL